VGLRLALIYDYDRAEPMLVRANETASNIYDYTSATRLYGGLLYQLGQPDAARHQFERALAVWDVFPTNSEHVRSYTDYQTELGWAGVLLGNGYCNEVTVHMDLARGHLNAIPTLGNDTLSNQYTATASQVASCVPNELPSDA
jgi:tetratricopeptide (TPR) repeat protein